MRRIMIAATAVVAMVVVTGSTGSIGSALATSPTSSNAVRTRALVQHLLHTAPTLPGAHRASSAPAPALGGADPAHAERHFVGAHTWWRAPQSPAAAKRYLHRHRPTGTSVSTGETTGRSGVAVWSIEYARNDTGYAYQPLVEISLVPLGSGVAVRVDAHALWLTPKPASDTVTGAESASVTLHRPAVSARHGHLGPKAAEHVAALIDGLHLWPPVALPCPASLPHTSDVVVFTTRTGTVRATIRPTGCATVTLVVHGRKQPPLFGGSDADAAILRALHLPADYGYPIR